jgi:hypothetical protein
MTEKELIEISRKRLEEYNKLPTEERVRRMIAWGLINERGEVLWNLEEAKKQEEAERAAQGERDDEKRAT